MFWAISRIAAPDFAERRDQGLQAHLDYLRSQKDILVLSGATTSDDAKQYVGSLLIVNVKTRAEAQRFAEGDPFADFIVHEAAHIFHNCKRRTIGLRETRTKEWLLDIEFRQRETFAYSCEAYARIITRAKSPTERRALATEYASKRRISAEGVDAVEVANIVTEAANARNGWKVILARCAPTTKPRSAIQLAREAVAARSLSRK